LFWPLSCSDGEQRATLTNHVVTRIPTAPMSVTFTGPAAWNSLAATRDLDSLAIRMSEIILLSIEPEEFTGLSRIRSGTESVYPNPAAPFSGSSYFLTVSIGWYLCRYRRAVGVEVAGSRGGTRARASSLVRRLVIRRVRH